MNKVAVLEQTELREIIQEAYSRGQREMVAPIHEAMVRAKYGLWCSTSEACEILNCTPPTLMKRRDKQDSVIRYKAEGREVHYNVDSLYEYIEQLGRRIGPTTTKARTLTSFTTTTK